MESLKESGQVPHGLEMLPGKIIRLKKDCHPLETLPRDEKIRIQNICRTFIFSCIIFILLAVAGGSSDEVFQSYVIRGQHLRPGQVHPIAEEFIHPPKPIKTKNKKIWRKPVAGGKRSPKKRSPKKQKPSTFTFMPRNPTPVPKQPIRVLRPSSSTSENFATSTILANKMKQVKISEEPRETVEPEDIDKDLLSDLLGPENMANVQMHKSPKEEIRKRRAAGDIEKRRATIEKYGLGGVDGDHVDKEWGKTVTELASQNIREKYRNLRIVKTENERVKKREVAFDAWVDEFMSPLYSDSD